MNKYRNNEELYFSYYLDELKEAGIIEGYSYEKITFTLSEAVIFNYVKQTQLKTKLKIEDKAKTLLQPCTYNMDFVIWGFKKNTKFASIDKDDLPILLLSEYEGISQAFIDIKGEFAGRTNTTQYTFPLKQKWLYQDYKIYTNKIIPNKLFAKTFTPKKVVELEIFKRDNVKKGIKAGDSKLKFKPTKIEDWLKTLK